MATGDGKDGGGGAAPTPAEALAATATAAGSPPPAPAPASDRLPRGHVLGRYTILELLGEGGMGVVYGAYDPDLDRKVALKLLRVAAGAGSASDDARARLLREARAMARLNHPNVITVYEVGTVGGVDFVAMEFVDGRTLSTWLREAPRAWTQVVDVFRHIGRGLAAAHAAGLVHRDLKPANVLIGNDGRVLVTDFGLARMQGADDASDGRAGLPAAPGARMEAALGATGHLLTRTGALIGTPAYMAPEQHLGRPADERSDQFSFCVALWEALFGARPFSGETLAELRTSVTAGKPASPNESAVPERLRDLLARGLRVDPAERFPSMQALLAELSARPALAGRRRRLYGGLGAAAVLLIGLVLALSSGTRRAAANDVCGSGGKSFAGVWDPGRREALRAAFAGSAGPEVFEPVAAALDDYRSRWQAAHRSVCERRQQPGFLASMSCLVERRSQLGELVAVLGDPDPVMIEHAVAAVGDIADPDRCIGAGARASAPALPADPARRRSVQQVRALLAEVQALRRARSLGRGLTQAEAALARAREVGYGPLEAEAAYELGAVRILRAETAAARLALEEAALLAEAAAHDEIRARALVAITEVDAHFSSDPLPARASARRARAAIERWGGDAALEADIDAALAALLVDEERIDEALPLYERALAGYERGGERSSVPTVLAKMAAIHMQERRWSKAHELSERAWSYGREVLGEEHPDAVEWREAYAHALWTLGRAEEAAGHLREAARFWQTARGKELLTSLGNKAPAASGKVSGQVVDPEGQPVAGAVVAAGLLLQGDGRGASTRLGGAMEHAYGVHRTLSDGEGRFTIEVAGTKPIVVASHPEGGESWPHEVTPGAEVRVTLRPIGSLQGAVEGQVAYVTAMPIGLDDIRYGVVAPVSEAGTYEFPRLARGEWRLFVIHSGSGANQSLATPRVVIEPGRATTLDLSVASAGGSTNLEIVVRGPNGTEPGTAQVFVLPGRIEATNVEELNERIVGQGLRFQGRFTQRSGDGARTYAQFAALEAGVHTICSVPLGGDIKDPDFLRTLSLEQAAWPVKCELHELGLQPDMQTITVELPPMAPGARD